MPDDLLDAGLLSLRGKIHEAEPDFNASESWEVAHARLRMACAVLQFRNDHCSFALTSKGAGILIGRGRTMASRHILALMEEGELERVTARNGRQPATYRYHHREPLY